MNVKDLTIEQLGVLIASLCKWTYDENERKMFFVKDGDIVGYDWISLDAMHEAEEMLVEVQKRKYGNILLDLTHPDEYYGEYDMVHATAKQRAEAFITVMDGVK